jgi:hypothetical protein
MPVVIFNPKNAVWHAAGLPHDTATCEQCHKEAGV